MTAAQATIPEVTVRRTIKAPPDVVFDAWLDAETLAAWMHPLEATHSTATVDARVGGAFEIVMYTKDKPLPHHGTYREIHRPNRLVFTWISQHTQDKETLVTVDFVPRGASTEVVITHTLLMDDAARRGHTAGWTSGLDHLEAHFRDG